MSDENLSTLADALANIARNITQAGESESPGNVFAAAVDRETRRLEADGLAGAAGCFGHFRSVGWRLLTEGH